ncbi:hypothetical protein FZEAL_4585 [Fusarium zealandicum]|uniref:Uncharacterized protein n=1 Tax=Fusarium zealandicum TaxID=1053134 RepID=A0A8H4ULY1_9HYPO|nr:hypothetical protein FZEAL_4585 [Fusarium zealandicum]
MRSTLEGNTKETFDDIEALPERQQQLRRRIQANVRDGIIGPDGSAFEKAAITDLIGDDSPWNGRLSIHLMQQLLTDDDVLIRHSSRAPTHGSLENQCPHCSSPQPIRTAMRQQYKRWQSAYFQCPYLVIFYGSNFLTAVLAVLLHFADPTSKSTDLSWLSANLAVALDRAAGIPCGVIRTHVELPGYFGISLAPNTLTSKERVSLHFHVGWVTLQGRDRCPQELEWRVVYGSVGPLVNIDPLLSKEPMRTISSAYRYRLLSTMRGSEIQSMRSIFEEFVLKIEKIVVLPVVQAAQPWEQESAAYTAALRQLVNDADIKSSLPNKAVHYLQPFMSERRSLKILEAKRLEIEGCDDDSYEWATSFLASAQGAGMDSVYLPRSSQLAPTFRSITLRLGKTLCNILPEKRHGFPRGFAANQRAKRLLTLGSDSETRIAALKHVYRGTYRFMTECYPSRETDSFDPPAKPLWLSQPEQQLYLNFLCGRGALPLFDKPTKSALLFVLGSAKTYTQTSVEDWCDDVGQVCEMTGIAPSYVFKFVDFHEHLISTTDIAVMNCSERFYSEHSENIRRGPDVHLEFEAWLNIAYPALSAVHQDELTNHADYPHTVYVYLLGRMITQRPSAERHALGSFVLHMERPGANIPELESEMDEGLEAFLSEEGPLEAFLSEWQGGLLKPYGVLSSLRKSCVLPDAAPKTILERLVAPGAKSTPHQQQDWFSRAS